MTAEFRARPADRDHRFFLTAAGAAFAIIFVGFTRTYFLKGLFGTPALPWLIHLHGFLMTSWFVLFFVQVRLVAAHRIAWHRRLGILGAVLAGLIVVVASTMACRAAARDLLAGTVDGPPPLEFLGLLLYALLVFATLVCAGLLLRRRKDYHKRFMLLSCLSMVSPGLARIPLEHVPVISFLKHGGPLGLFGLDLLLIYACIGYDTWRNRRLHPAFLVGVLLIGMEDLPFIWMFLSSPTWLHVAHWLVS